MRAARQYTAGLSKRLMCCRPSYIMIRPDITVHGQRGRKHENFWANDASGVGGRRRRVMDVSTHLWICRSTHPPPTRSLCSRQYTGNSKHVESDAIGTAEWRSVGWAKGATVYAHALRYILACLVAPMFYAMGNARFQPRHHGYALTTVLTVLF